MDGSGPQLPTAEDFHDPRFASGLDEDSAMRTFLGKTEAEAEAIFRRCFEVFYEDLASMGPRAFQFYVRPALRYLTSPDVYENGLVPVFLCLVVDEWLRRDAAALRPVAPELIDVLERFRAEHHRFAGSADGDEEDASYERAQLAAAAQRLRDLPGPPTPPPPPAAPRTPRERRLERRRERGP